MRLGLASLVAGLALAVAPVARAACTNPPGTAGDQFYNSTVNAMQYCNGSVWVNMGTTLGVGTLTAGDYCDTNGTNIVCTTPPTGTAGNVALSISPTFTGTVTGAASTWSGNVGIGTTAPTTAFQVGAVPGSGTSCNISSTGVLTNCTWSGAPIGTASITGVVPVVNGGTGVSTQTANGVAYVNGAGTAITSGSGFVFNGTDVGIGTATPYGLLNVAQAPVGTSYYGLLSIGTNFNSGAAAFSGSAKGTMIAANAPSTFAGNLMDLQEGGASVVNVSGSGNVGIGTTAPNFTLTINGSNSYSHDGGSGGLAVTDSANPLKKIYMGFDDSIAAGYVQSVYTGSVYEPLLLNAEGGNVGIGTTNPLTYALDVIGALNVSGAVTCGSGCAAGPWVASGANIVPTTADLSYNVGIGTAAPAAPLQVNGTSASYASNTGNLALTTASSTSGLRLGVDDSNFAWMASFNSLPLYINPGGNNIILNATAGNVGIGTTEPANLLDVYNTGAAGGGGGLRVMTNVSGGRFLDFVEASNSRPRMDICNNGNCGFLDFVTSGAMELVTSGASNLTFGTNNSINMTIQSGGNVGIGTTVINYPFQVRAAANLNGVINDAGGFVVFGGANDAGTALEPTEIAGTPIYMNGSVGFGTTSPSGRIDSETGAVAEWAGMFNYNAGTPTGAYGIWSYGTSYGVYGQTVDSQGVMGYASGSGNGVLGESVSGWSGNFQGANGVYGQSSGSGWAGEFNSTTSPNGVWIGNNDNNAQLCLNNVCTTSLPSAVNAVQLGAYSPGAKVGPYAFCALSGIGNPGGTDVSVNICGGSAGAYYWCVGAQSPVQTTELSCF